MTLLISYTEGFSKLFLDVISVEEIDGGIRVSYGSGSEIIPSESIADFRMTINCKEDIW